MKPKKIKKKSELKNNDLTNQNPSKKLLHATAAIFQKKKIPYCVDL